MSKEDISQALEKFFQKSPYKSQVTSVKLFGSQLNGNTHAKSDIDLIVYFEDEDILTLFDLSKLRHELSEALHSPIDLITENGIKPHLKEKIITSATNVYQRNTR